MNEKLRFSTSLALAGILGGSALAGCSSERRKCYKANYLLRENEVNIVVPVKGSISKFTYIIRNVADVVTIDATKQNDRKNVSLSVTPTESITFQADERDTYRFEHTDDNASFTISPDLSVENAVDISSKICDP